jgi:SWI/SNF-related matrix-associated actin-dependent regulator 1 of chromatin subfamily A
MRLAPEVERDVAPPIHQAIKRIAARSNYATTLDGAGFNKPDAEFGHKLAEGQPAEWSPKMLYQAWRLCNRYRGQLANEGIDFEALPVPPNPYDGVVTMVIDSGRMSDAGVTQLAPPRSSTADRRCVLVRDRAGVPLEFAIAFEYNPALVEAIKTLPRRTWNQVTKRWTVPASTDLLADLNDFLHNYGFHGDPDTVTFMQEGLVSARERREQAEAMAELSRAKVSEFDVPTLSKVDQHGRPQSLKPCQRAGIEYAVKAKRTFIGDQQGIGKTAEGIGTVEYLGAFPCLVVCKNRLKPNWARELAKWVPHRSVSVLGAKPDLFASSSDFVIINYEALNKYKAFLHGRHWASVMVDESQKLKSPSAIRTMAVRRLVEAQDTEVRLLLTGTPIMNNPGEFIAQIAILGQMDAFGGSPKAYKRRYVSGMNLQALNDTLRKTCYIRRTKSEVMTELEPKLLAPVTLELTNREEYERAEDDVITWIERHAAEDAAFLRTLDGMSIPARQQAIKDHAADAGRRAARAEALVRINALKYLAVKGKLEAAIEWIEDFLESGEKLVVFGERVEIQRAIADHFSGCARLAATTRDGARATTNDELYAEMDRFQTDPDCHLIVCGIDVGGEGFTLTAASDVVLMEFGWTPTGIDQAGDRCHREGQTDSVTVWHLLAENTIDDWIMELIDRKRRVVVAATDGQEVEDVELLTEIMKRLVEKRRSGAAA